MEEGDKREDGGEGMDESYGMKEGIGVRMECVEHNITIRNNVINEDDI